jgi:hypothetical protein
MKKVQFPILALIFLAIISIIVNGQNSSVKTNSENSLSDKEIKDGWKLLFDGKTTNGWMNAKTRKFPSDGWIIEDGCLIVSPATKTNGGGGDIVSVEKFRNFEL